MDESAIAGETLIRDGWE